jgi:S-adenosylmethionine:tRNA ribosyltransferase-isomerase
MTASTRFVLPAELAATETPEQRGLARDEVRLLVAEADREIRHATFGDLPASLRTGDLVVVNTSATRPAAVDGRRGEGRRITVHLSHQLPDGDWVVELRSPGGGARVGDAHAGEILTLPRGVTAVLRAAHPDPMQRVGSRLWRTRILVEGGVAGWLDRVGRPITYGHLRTRPPLADYQTIFARDPGSAEMPSAGRPFSSDVLGALTRRGVGLAEVTLHTAVSSGETGEPPPAEWGRVTAEVARQVNTVREQGGRVIAVGTTVTRALEAAADQDGLVVAAAGWTELVLGPARAPRVVDGLVTGWHEPDASHLLLLEAVAGPDLVARAYTAALTERYRWHEFGDSCLLLPHRPRRPHGRLRRSRGGQT